MAQDFLGKGWTFPVNVTPGAQIAMSQYENDIREAIWIILGTSKGERIMRPDFGCGIHDFVFTSVNRSVLTLIEDSIRDALVRWEHRIEVINISTSSERMNEGKLSINIEYKVRSTNNRFNLVYPFYLTEGEE